jgi:lipopolysaccharide/colanic/teichoic acid biosynthesis glycosyltransferase
MLNHTSQYEEIVASYTKRHFIKPGISGWAQINGLRGNLDKKMMEVRVQYDLEYIRNWNFWVDLDIIIRTIVLTITGDENAY